jgi:hypothetical protein
MELKTIEKKTALSLSLVAVLLVTVFLNEWLKTSQVVDSREKREIASVNAGDLRKQIDWEHGWARRLALTSSQIEGKTALKPSLKDEFLFGTLEGAYNVQFQDGRMVSMELNSFHSMNQGANLDPATLLMKYKDLIHSELADVRDAGRDGDKLMLELVGSSNRVLGRAIVETTENGSIQKINISNHN